MYETILKKINPKSDIGKILNHLQDVAEQVLSEKEFHKYLVKSCKDMDECEGMDGMLINGQYFDWREFNFKQCEMVYAWLGYFTDKQIARIGSAM